MKFYDQLSQSYDFFINWQDRIKAEDPFFQHLFQERMAISLLDLGCGTGGHSIHWGKMGYNVVGIDSSSKMIKQAQQIAEDEEVDIEFQCMKITDFAKKIQQKFDAVICVGNTVSHLLDKEALLAMFKESANALKLTGVAIFHILNYQPIMENKSRDLPVKSHIDEEGKEHVFFRFYDYLPHHLEFNMVVGVKDENGWQSRSHQLLHHPWTNEELLETAKEAGFTHIMCYGGYDFSDFNPEKSKDLLLVCELGDLE